MIHNAAHLLKNGKQKSDGTDSDSGAENNLDPSKHKKDLMNLKDTDPEFFKYLKTHDTKLLDFNVDDEDLGLGLSDDEDDLKHIPDNDLEVRKLFTQWLNSAVKVLLYPLMYNSNDFRLEVTILIMKQTMVRKLYLKVVQ